MIKLCIGLYSKTYIEDNARNQQYVDFLADNCALNVDITPLTLYT